METRSKKRKRQRLRLISISSHVSSWPDLPARFESLNDDTLGLILKFVGNKSYRPFGGLNYHCKEIYIASGMTKETFLFGYAPLSVIKDKFERAISVNDYLKLLERVGKGVLFYNRGDVLNWAIQQRKTGLLNEICIVAGEEGRIDLLNYVWNNVNDREDKRYVFEEEVDDSAARGGKLNVLKWFETKELSINEGFCAIEAACKGHLHVLQWLRDEQGLKLDGEMYQDAIGHLHVMKWLREQEVPWYKYTFYCTAQEGNLEILQWLHDEGCPWPENDDYRVPEEDLNPEVKVWLLANGYRNRIRMF